MVAVVNDGFGSGHERKIMFVVGLVFLVAMFGNWIIRSVEPNAAFIGVTLILLGYGDKIWREGGRR